MNDPIVFRGIERLLIIVGGIFFGYLGYRLFIRGLTAGESNLKFDSKAMKLILSGAGPGLFFMAFGAIILITAILKGGVSTTETKSSSGPSNTSVTTGTVMPESSTHIMKEVFEKNAADTAVVPPPTTPENPKPPAQGADK